MSKEILLSHPSTLLITKRRAERLALASLLVGATGIAFAPIFVRLSQSGPSATAFWRLVLSLPVFWLWMAVEGKRADERAHPTSPADLRGLAIAGLFFAADLAFWHESIKYTSVANATLLVNFAPVFVALGAWLLFRRRIGLTFVAGMLLALVGTTLMLSRSLSMNSQHVQGDAFGLITAIFYGGYLLSVSRLRGRFSTATVMAWSGLASSAALLLVSRLAGERLFPQDLSGWAVLLGLALTSQAGGQGMIAYALAHLPADFSSVTLLVQPGMSAVFAWLILGESIGLLQGLGGALVLGGIFIARQASQKYSPQRTPRFTKKSY